MLITDVQVVNFRILWEHKYVFPKFSTVSVEMRVNCVMLLEEKTVVLSEEVINQLGFFLKRRNVGRTQPFILFEYRILTQEFYYPSVKLITALEI